MRHSNTARLTEGAVLVALFAVLLLISIYVPVLSLILNIFLVLPFIIYCSKYPFRASLLMVAASIGVSAILGSVLAVPVAIAYSTTGLVMGWLIKEKKSKFIIFISSTLIFLFHVITQYIASIIFFEINIIEEIFTEMERAFTEFFTAAEASGLNVSEYESVWTANMNTMELLIPTLLVLSVSFLVWIMILVNFPIAKRFSVDVPKFNSFDKLSLPKSVIWYYLIVLIISLVSTPEPGSTFALMVANLQVALELLMILQGLSFIHFFGKLKGWGKARIAIFTIFGIVLSPFTRILGIIDLGFDLRKRLQNNTK
ncbi:DUF2232 domain-containing protein [Jeotgalibacillus sp. S-D1]|uniref:YybS family protein n=1 Tax=Jeotgalibacillus sp. S-D1 TaxID=2552189 RepID=UPI001059BCE6|nr:YybS family protein [Jeotgalibacillus sp. S-D1]TDL32044.1 DUF2232 domain-containing protein [Jeotgalibacillus sp. S-D1]